MAHEITKHDRRKLHNEWLTLTHILKTAASVLATWLMFRKLKTIWLQLHPQTGHGGARRSSPQREDLNRPGDEPAVSFVKQAKVDTGHSRQTIERWVKYAEDLRELLGEEFTNRLVTMGSRVANNPKGILVKLTKIKNPEQAEDVIRIYQDGAGEAKALEAFDTYMSIQEEMDREAARAAASANPDAPEPEPVPTETRVAWECVVGERAEVKLGGKVITVGVDSVHVPLGPRADEIVSGYLAVPIKAKTPAERPLFLSPPYDGRILSWTNCWAIASEVIEELPREVRGDVTVGRTRRDPAMACSRCSSVRFYRVERDGCSRYRCVACHKKRQPDDDLERQNANDRLRRHLGNIMHPSNAGVLNPPEGERPTWDWAWGWYENLVSRWRSRGWEWYLARVEDWSRQTYRNDVGSEVEDTTFPRWAQTIRISRGASLGCATQPDVTFTIRWVFDGRWRMMGHVIGDTRIKQPRSSPSDPWDWPPIEKVKETIRSALTWRLQGTHGV